VNEIIRVSLKSLTDTVKSQGMAIRELSKKINNKLSREEIENELKFKINNDDIFQAINNISQELDNRPTHEEINNALEGKMNKDEFMFYLNQKNNSNENININKFNDLLNAFENIKNEIFSKINKLENDVVKKDDFIILKNELDNKANIIDIENILETKEDKESINNILKNIADKNEINNMIYTAINKNKNKDNIGKNEFNQFLLDYQNDKKNLEERIVNKIDISEINNSLEKMKQKVDSIDNDFDRLIQSMKNQFQDINIVINNLEQKIIDNNEMNLERIKGIDSILRNKIEKEQVELLINKSKNNILEIINKYKNDENSNIKMFEDNINNKMEKMIFDNQSLLNDITNTNQNINNYFSQKQTEMENLMNRMRLSLNNNDIYNNNNNNINNNRELINTIENKLNQKLNEKLDISKFEEFLNGLKQDLDNKIDIIAVKKSNEEIIKEINDKIRQLYNDINKDLNEKANKNDLGLILSQNNLQGINNDALNEKLSITDFEDFINNITKQLKQKLDINKFNNIISTFNSNFENIHKDMNSKADIKSIIDILKNKLDTESFNEIINEIKKELATKTPSVDFSSAMDNQAIINETLVNENNIGRWLWKSGKVKNNLSVPWEIQIINTSNDNFLWEKDKSFIGVNEGGLYEIKLGFFADKKPMVQILVNGEVVISAINSNSYVIHQSSGGRMKGTGKTSFGNVTGLTMIDFILLPDNAKLSIAYTGEKGIGFLGLKKL